MLTINHLDVTIGDRLLLSDVNKVWNCASLIAVTGANGSGKTTFLNHIAGLALKKPGQIFLGDHDVFTMPPLLRAQRIASISQHDDADLETLVADRIAHGLYARRGSLSETRLVAKIAEEMGIIEFLSRPMFSLSGGQRKKVHIARALVDDKAELYILDEPDAGLDAHSREHLMSLLREFAKDGKIVIVSLHNRFLSDTYSDLVYSLTS